MTKSSNENCENKIQRIAALIILTVLSLLLSVLFVKSSSQPNLRPAPVVLQNKINPNTAPAGSLTRLPGVGRAKADAIISYRNKSLASTPKPFRDASDLDKITGFGPKTIEDINNYLIFD